MKRVVALGVLSGILGVHAQDCSQVEQQYQSQMQQLVQQAEGQIGQ